MKISWIFSSSTKTKFKETCFTDTCNISSNYKQNALLYDSTNFDFDRNDIKRIFNMPSCYKQKHRQNKAINSNKDINDLK